MGLLKFIVILFCIFYLIKIILRFLIPILMRRFLADIQNKFKDKFNQHDQFEKGNSSDEGKVTIERKYNSTNKRSDGIGEYVDFEEINEK